MQPPFQYTRVLASFVALAAVAASEAGPILPPGEPAPSAFPDQHHVPNGCYLSAFAFVQRFRHEFPAERAALLGVTLRDNQTPRAHTIAVVSWRGEWWGRDEFFGVFPLDATVGAAPVETLRRRAARALERHARARLSAGARSPAPPTDPLPRERRIADTLAAATLLPGGGEIVWSGACGEEVPRLFFKPSPAEIAVYDPTIGTVTAVSAVTDARLAVERALAWFHAVRAADAVVTSE